MLNIVTLQSGNHLQVTIKIIVRLCVTKILKRTKTKNKSTKIYFYLFENGIFGYSNPMFHFKSDIYFTSRVIIIELVPGLIIFFFTDEPSHGFWNDPPVDNKNSSRQR